VMTVHIAVFWVIISCNLVRVNQLFGEICCLHLQGRRISRARNQGESRASDFLLWLFFDPEKWRRHVPPKRLLNFNGLHGIISQKVEFFNLFIGLCWQFVSNPPVHRGRGFVRISE
jgi:hypothetical protein